MNSLADKCVLAYNEAEKRKALGRPGIDPRMAAKKKKLSTDQSAPSRQDEPRIVFPSSMTGLKRKVMSTASELLKTIRLHQSMTNKKKNVSLVPPLLNKLFSRRTCLCPTLQLIKWRLRILRLPPMPLTLS